MTQLIEVKVYSFFYSRYPGLAACQIENCKWRPAISTTYMRSSSACLSLHSLRQHTSLLTITRRLSRPLPQLTTKPQSTRFALSHRPETSKCLPLKMLSQSISALSAFVAGTYATASAVCHARHSGLVGNGYAIYAYNVGSGSIGSICGSFDTQMRNAVKNDHNAVNYKNNFCHTYNE